MLISYNYDLSKVESILINPGDLPAGCLGAQIRHQAPKMFEDLPAPDASIYQQFQRKESLAGGVTIILYRNLEHVDSSFKKIAEGLGKSQQPVPGIGEECSQVFISPGDNFDPATRKRLGLEGTNCDLCFVRTPAIVHIRMIDIFTKEDASSYAIRLDRRLSELFKT